MSKVEREKLKKLAEAATQGEWTVRQSPFKPDDPDQCCVQCKIEGKPYAQSILEDDYFEELSRRADAEYIAAANPSTMLALLSELEQAERERDALKKLQIEELHMVGNQIDARLKGDPWVVMAFAQAWVDYFKDMGAENFVVVGVKHITFGDFEVVMRKVGSKSPYHVAGEAVARAEASEAALRTLRQASRPKWTGPEVKPSGRYSGVVKLSFPTIKEAYTFKDALAAALAAEGGK